MTKKTHYNANYGIMSFFKKSGMTFFNNFIVCIVLIWFTNMDIYFLGWACSFLLLVFLITSIIQKIKLKRKITALNHSHEQYIFKQIVDLRKICHNINTPLNSVITVFEVFKLKLYGELPTEYITYAEGANEAIEDLKKNVADIQSYCNYYAQTHLISIKDIQNNVHIELKNPYVLNT